jgi:hypothetical protein
LTKKKKIAECLIFNPVDFLPGCTYNQKESLQEIPLTKAHPRKIIRISGGKILALEVLKLSR